MRVPSRISLPLVLPDCTTDKPAYLDYIEALHLSWREVSERLMQRGRDYERALREWAVLRKRADAIADDVCSRATRAALITYFDADLAGRKVFARREASLFRVLWRRDFRMLVYSFFGPTKLNFEPPWSVAGDKDVLRANVRTAEAWRDLLSVMSRERATLS